MSKRKMWVVFDGPRETLDLLKQLKGQGIMPSTPERERAARPTDQEVEDQQQSQLQQEREERNTRLGIGNHTEDGPKPEGKLGDTLREKEQAALEPQEKSEDDQQ